MMDDGKNKDTGEFDDDVFDDDFSDTEFDESAYDETADYDPELSGGEDDFGGDDFEVEDWGDDAEEAAGKKTKKSKPSGGGLSFNTIVIIGAVVLGAGVLVFNVMNETNKADATKPSIFQSIIGIGGIMDGMLFGDKAEETAATETPSDNQGFLNDPTTLTPTADQNNPPQPTPIAPSDNAVAVSEPLMPMPDAMDAPSPEAPRGPDDVPPVDGNVAANDVASPETAQSAEDILKQAMANREQKLQGEAAPENTEEASSPEQVSDVSPPPLDEPPQEPSDVPAPQSDAPADQTAAIAPVAEPASQPVEQPPAVMPEEAKQDITANKEAVTALESKLDTLLQRMDKIESDLGTIRENNAPSNDTAELEKTVAALKEEIASLKSRPTVQAKSQSGESQESEPAPAPKPAKKKKVRKAAAPEDQAYSPSKQATKPASGQWELRAAQPGRAWVSKAGERDMQAVSVGDTLPGIGRIGSITYMNGRWMVTGSQGNIQQ